jgi:hypothetical protein
VAASTAPSTSSIRAGASPPFVAIATTTSAPGTTRQHARWPGVAPSWPTTGTPSQSKSIRPRPQPYAARAPISGRMTCGSRITANVPGGSTRVPSAATPSARNIRPSRTSSRIAAHGVEPAGAFDCGSCQRANSFFSSPMCPAATRKSTTSSAYSARWLTPSGSITCRRRADSQVLPRSRATRAPSAT